MSKTEKIIIGLICGLILGFIISPFIILSTIDSSLYTGILLATLTYIFSNDTNG